MGHYLRRMENMAKTEETGYSLDELSRETGLDRRVIRSYIEQKLLRGPESRGRYARYSQYHADRLLAIRALKEQQGLSLEDVRSALRDVTADDVRHLASTMRAEPRAPATGSALDYLRSVQPAPGASQRASETPEPPPGPMRGRRASLLSSPPPAPPTPVDQLAMELARLFQHQLVARQAKGQDWTRIPVTPDFELHVRGIEGPVQLARLERVADYLREILLGGLNQ